jgi:hypothetical protein
VLQLFGRCDVRGVTGVWLGLWLGACAAVAIACGAAQPKTSATPPAAAPDLRGQAPHAQAHAEIDALDRQIADELAQAHVSPPALATCSGAACAEAMSLPFATPMVTDPDCHPANTDKCTSACTLSTSICSNQQRICDLAKQLAGDDWAAGKCERARASCKAAHDSCCTCVL